VPVFISYSHSDKGFVDRLGKELVKRNTHVWIDRWELNVGDSIIGKVQEAIQRSGALLVVLSKASVASEWCKKELNFGLVRELDEKKVSVLPVLLEDCDIPPFLRDKMYADFRTSFEDGLDALTPTVSKFSDLEQGRIRDGAGYIDWSETWRYGDDGLFRLDYTFVEAPAKEQFTLLTHVSVTSRKEATKRYQIYEAQGLDWLGRMMITEVLSEIITARNMSLLLQDQFPRFEKLLVADPKLGVEYELVIECRRLGEDNGKDQQLSVVNYFQRIREHARGISRPLSETEAHQLLTRLNKT
jgi:hypothetical protein